MTEPFVILQARVGLDDPHACTDASDTLSVFNALFDPLVRREGTGFAPALATAWSMSEDARTTTFALREGVRFHDGEPFDAGAARYALERMARPDMGATLGAPGVYAQYLAGLTVETPNAHTVRLTTAEPFADILDVVSAGAIVSPRAVEAAGDDLAARAVGTGPYRLDAAREGTIELAAADGPFEAPAAHERLEFRRETDAHGRLARLEGGAAHLANGLPAAAASLPAERFSVHDVLVPTALILMFNCAEGPAADPRVRRALNLAIDRDALVRDVLGGEGAPLHGYVSPLHWGHDPAAPPFARDVADAKRLLAEAGHGGGLTLQLYCPTRLPDEAEALAAALGRQLAAVGVGFAIHLETDRTHYANQVRLKNIHDVCVFDSSPMSAFRVLHEKIDSRVRGSWWQGYANGEVETLIDRARRTVDREARLGLLRRVYRLLQDDPPWLYLYNHRRRLGLAGRHPRPPVREDGVLDVRRLAPGAPGRP